MKCKRLGYGPWCYIQVLVSRNKSVLSNFTYNRSYQHMNRGSCLFISHDVYKWRKFFEVTSFFKYHKQKIDILCGLWPWGWSTRFWKEGISGGGGSCSQTLPPLSGTWGEIKHLYLYITDRWFDGCYQCISSLYKHYERLNIYLWNFHFVYCTSDSCITTACLVYIS